MNYSIELDFLLSFFKNYHLSYHIYSEADNLSSCDLGFHKMLGQEDAYQVFQTFLSEDLQTNCIYKITDNFTLIYHVLQLPAPETQTFLVIGPYINVPLNKSLLVEYMEKNQIAPQFFNSIQDFFYTIPLIKDETPIQSLLQTFAEKVWKSPETLQFKSLNYEMREVVSNLNWSAEIPPKEDNTFDMRALETYFARENELVLAVVQGNLKKADSVLASLNPAYSEQAADDSLPYFKLQTIVINTLLRKAAEMNSVSIYQISRLSSSYTKKLKYISSPKSCIRLQHEMVRKYCLAIQNHSSKNYSNLIQDVIKLIDADPSADLSLRHLAKQMNVNASYLSNQFRKETGSTLTDFVNKKRVNHAIYLLNTTSLQIQTIAQYCGINDVNYFTKLFKKYIQKSPTEYRKKIQKKE